MTDRTSSFEVHLLGLLSVLERLPIPIAIAFDPASRRVQGNRAFRELLGLAPGENASLARGKRHSRRFRLMASGTEIPIAQLPLVRAASEGVDVPDVAMRLERSDGMHFDLIASAWPLRDAADEVAGAIVVLVDVTESHEAEERARAALEALAESERRYRLIAEAMPQFVWLDAPDGSAIYANQRWLDYTGLTEEQNKGFGWTNVVHPEDAKRLGAERERTLRTGQEFEGECRYRGKDGKYRWFLFRSIPVRNEAGEVTSWLGTATDIDRQKRAEQQQTFFALASDVLGSTLDVDTTLERIAHLAVGRLGSWCQIDLPDREGNLRVAVVAHDDPQKAALLEELIGQRPFARDVKYGPPAVFATGEPQVMHLVREDAVTAVIPQKHHREIYRAVGYYSGLIVPLRFGDRILGTLGIASDDPSRLYTDFDLSTATELARRGATALENAQSFTREHRLATTLQSALLPADLPHPHDVTFFSAYAAATQSGGEAVGGDWYDAFTLKDGRIVISVGDVAGHGVHAAVTMSVVRQAIRAASIEGHTPRVVLERANEVLALERSHNLVSAIVAFYSPRSQLMSYAIAGHPQPILVEPAGRLRRFEECGPPLGSAFDPALLKDDGITVPPGSAVVLFTDGLLEYDHDVLTAQRRIESAIADRGFLADENPAQALIRAVLDKPQQDDIAVLIMRTI